MSQILGWLAGGDLRSDGLANEAAAFILQNPDLFAELFAGLRQADDVIRGRAADALEKVARERPDLLQDHAEELLTILRQDGQPMVRWHLAMILGHLASHPELADKGAPALLALLEDESIVVRCWAIVSLCIIGRKYPAWRVEIAGKVARHEADPSAAVRNKVGRALALLSDEEMAFPKGWVKSIRLGEMSPG